VLEEMEMTRSRTIIGIIAAGFLATLVGAGVLAWRHFFPGGSQASLQSAVAPEPLSPAEGEFVSNGSLTDQPWTWEFRWSEVPGAEKYQLHVFGAQGEEPWIDKTTDEPRHREVNASGWSIGEASRNGWRWKVRTQVNGQWSEWSKLRIFHVSQAVKKPSVNQEEYDERIKTEFAVVYLIFRGEASRPDQLERAEDVSKVMKAVPLCLDIQTPDGRLEMNGDGPFRVFWKLGLVKDVEAFGMKQSFGRVRAYDPKNRALVIEVGLPPVPRSEWKDAAELDRLVAAYTVRRSLSRVVEGMAKEQSDEQLAFLMFRREIAKDLFGGFDKIPATKERLKALLDGPNEMRAVSQHALDFASEDIGIVVYPIKEFGAFVRKIDFAEVLFSDAETRVIILGPLRKDPVKSSGARE